MAEIEVLSTTLVQAPSNPNSINPKIPLTCCDLKLILVDSIQKGLLFPEPEPELIHHFKSSLSQALQLFYPLAGRLYALQHNDNTVSFFINCNNGGAQFVHAVASNLTISDVLQPLYVPPFVASFFPLTEFKNFEGVSNPLLGVQITELPDGILIGCTINHSVADGTTFWNFVRTWSEISRGVNFISKPPVFDKWFRNCTMKLASVLDPLDEFNPPPLQERLFHFSKESIARLKAKANLEARVDKATISSLQSLLANLWVAVVRNRETKPENDTRMFLQVGYRPEIPEEYFGNAVQMGKVELKAKQVREKGLGFVALEFNKLVLSYTQEKVQKEIDLWSRDPKFPILREFASLSPLMILIIHSSVHTWMSLKLKIFH